LQLFGSEVVVTSLDDSPAAIPNSPLFDLLAPALLKALLPDMRMGYITEVIVSHPELFAQAIHKELTKP
jgi:hypothetical protein